MSDRPINQKCLEVDQEVRDLLEAVKSDSSYIYCKDIAGKNWFDTRDSFLSIHPEQTLGSRNESEKDELIDRLAAILRTLADNSKAREGLQAIVAYAQTKKGS